jgi:hypothetical protein
MLANEFVDLCRRVRFGVAGFNLGAAFFPGVERAKRSGRVSQPIGDLRFSKSAS